MTSRFFVATSLCFTSLLITSNSYARETFSMQDQMNQIVESATQKITGVTLPSVPLPGVSKDIEAEKDAADEQAVVNTNASGMEANAPVEAQPIRIDPNNPDTLPDLASELEGFEPSYGPQNISLLFTNNQMHNMRRLLSFYEAKKLAESRDPNLAKKYDDLIDQLIQQPAADGELELPPLPSYYLGTILYHNSSKWAVWINGKKFTPKDEIPHLEITSVTPQKVSFKWEPDNLSGVLEPWGLHQKGERKYGHRSATTQALNVDFNTGVVVFSLSRNQTFNAADMEIYEGKLEGGYNPFSDEAMAAAAAEEQAQLTNAPTGSFQPNVANPTALPSSATPANNGNMRPGDAATNLEQVLQDIKPTEGLVNQATGQSN